MRILISGGSGFIGQSLAKTLTSRGDEVLIWSRQNPSKPSWIKQLSEIETPVDVIINLAGAGIIDKRWTPERKKLLRSSRLETTRNIVEWISKQDQKPKCLISASAIGFYGSQKSMDLNESSSPVDGFTHRLCADWESEALKAEEFGVRVCLIRTGIVLGNGGALKKMLLPFKLGLGGPIASGKQWMSWIHLDDEISAICWLIDDESLQGPFNLTAPEPVTNEVFTKELASTVRRPAIFRVPAIVMKGLLGESSELLIEGQCVRPVALQNSGFQFKYTSVTHALQSLV